MNEVWIESYRVHNQNPLQCPDVPSSSHRPTELKERYASAIQHKFALWAYDILSEYITTSISSMVLICFDYWFSCFGISAVSAASYFWRASFACFFHLAPRFPERRTLLRTGQNGTSQRAGDPLFGWSGTETWHENTWNTWNRSSDSSDPQRAFSNGLETRAHWRAFQNQALTSLREDIEDLSVIQLWVFHFRVLWHCDL